VAADVLRVEIRVRPGASRTVVGGRYGDALVVRVTARAVDQKATDAALRAVAEAFGVPRRQVRLVTGATSRTKVVEIAATRGATAGTLAALLARS
jgi:uncharacterized protein (TIGR00251 family)